MNEDAHIYVHLDDISTEGMMDERISLISMPEICAQLYWENYPIYPRGAVADVAASLVDVPHAGPVHRVVLVGEGDFTECILEQALLTNIFDVPGGVRYDVLGSLHEWQMMHLGLAMALETNNDELYFHMGAWYEHRDLLYNADRIILCGDVSDNIRIANELQQEPIRALHVRADGESGLRIMGRSKPGSAGPEHVEVFGTKQQICTFGIIATMPPPSAAAWLQLVK